MRTTLLSALAIVIGVGALAAAADISPAVKARNPGGPGPHPAAARCCHEKVWDYNGKEFGDLLEYDNRYGPQQLIGFAAYRLKGGDTVTLQVTPEVVQGLQSPGGSTALFTTTNCTGTTMFVNLYWPPLAKRYAMVLLGGSAGSLMLNATNAWLWVTDPLPSRAMPPAGTVFHSQWTEMGNCSNYPAPGYTVMPPGGFWMHRVEDLFAKYQRPFYIDY
jgi:hypothetical protein